MSIVTRKFPKEFLQRMVGEDIDPSEGEQLDDELIDTSRWSTIHKMTFKADDGLIYQSGYSRGATESQDESPYEHDNELIECVQVESVEVMTVQYRQVQVG